MVNSSHFKDVQSVLENAITQSFEQMAFNAIDRFEIIDSVPELDENNIWTAIDINLPIEASVELVMEHDLACSLCSATLGEEITETSDPRAIDLLSEILNTFTGFFLRELDGVITEIDMSTPMYGHVEATHFDGGDDDSRTILECHIGDDRVLVLYTEIVSA